MGIDLLDVSFRIEKTTGVRLDQSDWQSLAMNGDVTVGDLYSMILCRLKYDADVKTDIQLNESVWQQTRSALAKIADRPPTEVTMQNRLEELLPESSRPEMWKSLQQDLKLSLPLLELPVRLRRRLVIGQWAILLAIPLLTTSLLVSKWLSIRSDASWWLIPVTFVCSGLACSQIYVLAYMPYWSENGGYFQRTFQPSRTSVVEFATSTPSDSSAARCLRISTNAIRSGRP